MTDYRATRGEIRVVPKLNFESIIKRSRGVYGDMNREFKTVVKIKQIITEHPAQRYN